MHRFGLPSTLRLISACVVLACATLSAFAIAVESPFAQAVMRTSPVVYFHIDSKGEQSGAQALQARGPVTFQSPGVDAGAFAFLNGRGTFLETTQRGGVGRAGSIMAWVKLVRMPAQAGRILYVAGISQNGNDFDVQFEPDNTLRFYTAQGSHLTYTLPSNAVGSWHMIVATFDIDNRWRSLYWDGNAVASDNDAGKPGKMAQFNIGGTPLWGGRFFEGGIDEVALWSKALTADQVANLYAAVKPGASSAAGASAAITTTAQVEIEDANGKIPLRAEEKIAVMFLAAFQSIESDCQRAGGACTLEQMASRLKHDPSTDPNYNYSVKVNGRAWEAHADPRRQGIGGFYYVAKFGSPDAYYNANGPAGAMDRQLTSRSVMGDSFSVR